MDNKNPEPNGPNQYNIDYAPSGWRLHLSRFIVFLQRVLNRWDKKIANYAHNPNPNGLEDMTATAFADNVVVYESSLLWALRSPKITNIAITGPFGSGKTSLIRTFQRKHQELRFLYISLAKFDETYKEDDDDWRMKIELSIMQQLFYHVKNSKLPDSRFKKINKTTKWQQLVAALCLLVWGVAALLVFRPQLFQRFTFWDTIDKIGEIINQTSLVLFLLGIGCGFYKLYNSPRKRDSKLS